MQNSVKATKWGNVEKCFKWLPMARVMFRLEVTKVYKVDCERYALEGSAFGAMTTSVA